MATAVFCSFLLILLSYFNESFDLGAEASRLLLGLTGLSVLAIPILARSPAMRRETHTADQNADLRDDDNHAMDQVLTGYLSSESELILTNPEVVSRLRLLAEHISQTMEDRKPFLHPDFTLEDLARLMGVPKHHLYHCLNGYLQVRFTRLRADYRIRHAMKLMVEGARAEKSLEEIGQSSGFSSRSAFISAFRDVTGLTPGEYLRTIGPE